MTRAEMFAKAQADREAQKADDAARGSGGGTFPSVAFTPITIEPQKRGAIVVRLLGNPYNYRTPGVGTDHKVVFHNWITGSGGKKYPFVFPTVLDANKAAVADPDFILTKFIKAVTAGKWNPELPSKEPGKKGAMEYFHANEAIFKQVYYDGRPEAKYASGWRPSGMVLMNCINRAKMDWHRSEKKTLVVSKHYAPAKENGKSGFFETGVSVMLYNAVVDDVTKFHGDYEEFDVILERMPDAPFYKAHHGLKDGYKFADQGLDKLVVEGELIEVERSWTMWDFDAFYPVSTYKAIYSHLGNFFKQGDALLGTTFFEELQGLVATEQTASGEAPSRSAPQPQSQAPQASTQTVTSRPAPQAAPPPPQAPAPVRRAAPVAIDWDALYSGTFNGTPYLGVPNMTGEMRSMVDSVNPDGSFKYVSVWNGVKLDPNTNLYQGGTQNFVAPGNFTHDPLTGEELPPPEVIG